MKLAAVVLSLLVMFLNAVPCCWEICEEDRTEIHTEQGTGTVDSCSPFLSCGSCTGFILQQDSEEFSTFTSPFRVLDEQRDINFHFEYATKIWQPPKSA